MFELGASGVPVIGRTADLFMSRPGYQGLNRADVMALMVHELRHAGHLYSLFSDEAVRGQRLFCHNISRRIAEVDAWQKVNHWLVTSVNARLLQPSDFGSFYGDTNFAEAAYNNDVKWSVDDLWDHQIILDYRRSYEPFDEPPVYNCPQSGASAHNVGLGCIDRMVLHHI